MFLETKKRVFSKENRKLDQPVRVDCVFPVHPKYGLLTPLNNLLSGAYRGKSLIKKKSINDDIAVYSYLAKYDKKFYRFLFVFYNNGIKTKIYKFLFDDTAELEIEESLKLYM
jgi:hypothetical protein